MLSWLVSKLTSGVGCIRPSALPIWLQNGSNGNQQSVLGSARKIVPKLVVLTTIFTVLLLLMHSGLHSSRSTIVRLREAWRDSAFTVPPMSRAKPVKRPLQPPVKGMPCRELHERFPDSIPPLVHWTTKDGRVHKLLVNTVKSWLALQHGDGTNSTVKWYYMHWDDIQMSNLIGKHYPLLSKSYLKLANGLERSDIGRLVVLHHVGGLYVDLDVELRRNPTSLLTPQNEPRDGEVRNSSSCRTALWSQEPPEHADFIFNRPWLISNAVMMSRANHSFLSYVLSTWPSWYEANWARKRRAYGDAVYVTGPLMLQAFYDKYAALSKSERPEDWCDNIVAEADAFQPIMDPTFISRSMKPKCANIEKLSEPRQTHCRNAVCANFQNREVPNASYTVHHFMHLSYTNKMKLDDSKCILRLLPILTCKI